MKKAGAAAGRETLCRSSSIPLSTPADRRKGYKTTRAQGRAFQNSHRRGEAAPAAPRRGLPPHGAVPAASSPHPTTPFPGRSPAPHGRQGPGPAARRLTGLPPPPSGPCSRAGRAAAGAGRTRQPRRHGGRLRSPGDLPRPPPPSQGRGGGLRQGGPWHGCLEGKRQEASAFEQLSRENEYSKYGKKKNKANSFEKLIVLECYYGVKAIDV